MTSPTMSRAEPRWLVHELVFGGFLAVTWTRLILAAGPLAGATLVYAGFLASAVGAVIWYERSPSDGRMRLRLGLYALLMNVAFVHMKVAVPLFHPAHVDALLVAWDQRLFGTTPSLLIEPYLSRPLTEGLTVCYALFIPYLFVALARYVRGPIEEAKAFYAGLFTLYGVGFLAYTLLPALGPYVELASSYAGPLQGYWLTARLLAAYPLGTNGADVFPSLHCAVSLYILLCDRRFHPAWFAGASVPTLGLCASTMALRFHYGVDVMAGLALAIIAVAVCFRTVNVTRENNHVPHPIAV